MSPNWITFSKIFLCLSSGLNLTLGAKNIRSFKSDAYITETDTMKPKIRQKKHFMFGGNILTRNWSSNYVVIIVCVLSGSGSHTLRAKTNIWLSVLVQETNTGSTLITARHSHNSHNQPSETISAGNIVTNLHLLFWFLHFLHQCYYLDLNCWLLVDFVKKP